MHPFDLFMKKCAHFYFLSSHILKVTVKHLQTLSATLYFHVATTFFLQN